MRPGRGVTVPEGILWRHGDRADRGRHPDVSLPLADSVDERERPGSAAVEPKPATRHLASPHRWWQPFWRHHFDVSELPPAKGGGNIARLGPPRQGPWNTGAPGEHEQHRVASSHIRHGMGDRLPLGLVETMEAAAIDKEVEAVADARTGQVGDIAEHKPHRLGGHPASCPADRPGHVVDTDRLPAATGQLDGLQPSAATQVERPTVRRRTTPLLEVEESGSPHLSVGSWMVSPPQQR